MDSLSPRPPVTHGTHGEEAPDAGPHGVVGQLSPAALVHDGALVDAAADKVDADGDEGDDADEKDRP